MKKTNTKREVVAIVGLGYVGLPLALLADKKGYEVIGIDIDERKVELINDRVSPFSDDRIERDLPSANFIATPNFQSISRASIVVICVPTPVYDSHKPDLRPLISSAESIGSFIQKDQLIIIESTINPGVSESIILPILTERSGLIAGTEFSLSHCPERVNPGDAEWTVANIPRVVGSLDNAGLERTINFYRSITSGEILPMGSLKEAEAVKIVENAFRDINIAFVNELAMSFSKLDIDVTRVIAGASTKPFSFMPHFPGCGVGGHCIPVDPYYLIEYARENGFQHRFLSLARNINSNMPKFTVEMLVQALEREGIAIADSKIAVLGLSYKPQIDDCRESPSFAMIQLLEEKGAQVTSYDPFVPAHSNVKSLEEAMKGTQAILVATAHKLFETISPTHLRDLGVRVVVDGRNCLNKESMILAGLAYHGIGR